MLHIYYQKKIFQDLKRAKKRNYNLDKFYETVEILQNQKTLPSKYKDHALAGSYSGYRECHIESDWLLIYKIENDVLILVLSRTGTHSDLF